ncbi:uncharacterized protein LOC127081283 [Lathyrus oleraceus]|uniref:uncharacterized protein LOC127081283 n=1 Tax=Pisum sativum TaxID=3888 RepID=UPI0021D21197|nr:uncharacterized protein LOC127081283 [Pisum sativum]
MEVPDSERIAATLYLGKSVVDDNLKTKGGLPGFHLSFLLATLDVLVKEENWKAFNVVLTCSVYGIVLFPNVVDFVDINAIHIFMMRNPIPTLLGDIYHSIHYRNHKKRDMMEKFEVIVNSGEFPNVTLMGVRGGINYNPMLPQRQLGYALKGLLEDRSIQESLFYNVADGVEMMKKAAKACNHISCKGKEFFGKKDCVAYPPYMDWIKDKVQTVLLPFLIEKPLYPQEPDHPDLMPREHFNKTLLLNKKWK